MGLLSALVLLGGLHAERVNHPRGCHVHATAHVVGNVGLGGALADHCDVALHLLSTGLSVSSIATNRTVGAGGAYYMISRALGAPAGAAIGIPLFFAQALSVAFYVKGFTESIRSLFAN